MNAQKMQTGLAILDDIIAYEDGSMHPEDVAVFFQKLVDTGTLYHLQGSYQREAARLAQEGLIDLH